VVGQEEHLDRSVEPATVEHRREPFRLRVTAQDHAPALGVDPQRTRALVVVALEAAQQREPRPRVGEAELAAREVDARRAVAEAGRRARRRQRSGPQRDVEALREPVERRVVVAVGVRERDAGSAHLPRRERGSERLPRDVGPVARSRVVDPRAVLGRAHDERAPVTDVERPHLALRRGGAPRDEQHAPRRAREPDPALVRRRTRRSRARTRALENP
jgi:hypothetical protein